MWGTSTRKAANNLTFSQSRVHRFITVLRILEVIFSNEGFLFVCLSFAFFCLFVCFICLFALQKKSVLYCDYLVRSEPELKLIRNRNRPILIHNQNSDPFFWRVLVSQIRETMLER